jgi:hypothetical protein
LASCARSGPKRIATQVSQKNDSIPNKTIQPNSLDFPQGTKSPCPGQNQTHYEYINQVTLSTGTFRQHVLPEIPPSLTRMMHLSAFHGALRSSRHQIIKGSAVWLDESGEEEEGKEKDDEEGWKITTFSVEDGVIITQRQSSFHEKKVR